MLESLGMILAAFRPVFTKPSYGNFATLVYGWVLAGLRGGTVSAAVRAAGALASKHFSTYYRFYGRGAWDADWLGLRLLRLFEPWLVPGPVVLAVDDTLARKTGKHIWGANLHHDPLAWMSNAVAFGHNWVVLAVVVHIAWVDRPLAVPILWRLYRSRKKRYGPTRQGRREKKTTGEATASEHRSRPQLALELITVARRGFDPTRSVVVVADSAYCGRSVLRKLPQGVDMVGPLPMNAALYGLPPERQEGQPGAPRKKGERLPPPQTDAASSQGWLSGTVSIYRKSVAIRYKSRVALWYSAGGSRPLHIVLIRDPSGQRRDCAFFATELCLSPQSILQTYAQRWSLEVAFRDIKQILGFERPQSRSPKAVLRTAPFCFVVYAVCVSWFATHGQPLFQNLFRPDPWYQIKRNPSFADMLRTLRFALMSAHLSQTLNKNHALSKSIKPLQDLLCAAA